MSPPRAQYASGPIVVQGAPYTIRTLHPTDMARLELWAAISHNPDRYGEYAPRPALTLDQLVEITLPIIRSCGGPQIEATVTITL